MVKVACLDYSLRQPGVCIGDTLKPYFANCLFYYVGKTKYENCLPMRWDQDTSGLKLNRYERHLAYITNILGKHNIKRVYVESIAYRAQNFQFDQAMATAYVTERLHQLGYIVEVVGIGTIKKAFSGNGRATKAQMRAHFKNVGLSLPTPLGFQADLIDAYAIFYTVCNSGGEHVFVDKRIKIKTPKKS